MNNTQIIQAIKKELATIGLKCTISTSPNEYGDTLTIGKSKYNKIQIIINNLPKDKITNVLQTLKKSKNLRFSALTDIFASDFPTRKNRFEIIYNLLSYKHNMRLIIKSHIDEHEHIESAHEVYPGAVWFEREIFDMYGVKFDNSPDNRRILTDYGFVGHPLRKDFPVTGHIEVKYDDRLEKVIYEPVSLDQEFRDFDFLSPWRSPQDKLPGDEKAK